MHINRFHLTHFHSCLPVIIRGVWVMVQFYMSCAEETFFSPPFFLYAGSATECLQMTVFQFEGMKWILKRLIHCKHILQPLLLGKLTNPPETTTSHLNTAERFSIIFWQSVRTRQVKGGFIHSDTVNCQFSSTPDKKMYYKNVLEHRG